MRILNHLGGGVGVMVSLVVVSAAWCEPIQIEDTDKPILTSFLEHARAEARGITVEKLRAVQTPEMYCWVELPKMNMSLTAFELTGDRAHLRDFDMAFGHLRQLLVKDPDGLLGWRGKPIPMMVDPARPDVVINEIQVEFRAVAVAARFLELADSTEETRKEFAAQRAGLLDLLENHLARKWDARGDFADLGTRGGVYRANKEYIPRFAGITLAHEKQAIIIEALLNLYRVTGNDAHLKRAVQLGTYLKRCLTLKDGRYQWNHWDPSGDWDISADDRNKWKGWIGPEPKGQWFAATIGSAVLLYHHGVVFDKTDIERFRRTQMDVGWNGDAENPKFAMVNGSPVREPERMISLALTPFDERLAVFLFAGKMQDERLAKRGSSWSGGVQANDWLMAKYILSKRARDGQPVYAESAKAFLARPENEQFLKSLAFEVTGDGYTAPRTPGR